MSESIEMRLKALELRIYGENTVKPEPKTKRIDMSVCIESGIDCEFSCSLEQPEDVWSYGKLKAIDGEDDMPHLTHDNNWYEHCRPRMNHIHACPNGFDKCPLPEGFKIKWWFNIDGESSESLSHCLMWDKNVTMFEVTGIAEGFEL